MYDSTKTKCIGFLKKLHGKVLWCKLPWDQRMLVVESELKMSLIQLPAQRRLSHEVRPERSGLWTSGSWKPPKTDTARPFWALVPPLHCLAEERFLPAWSLLLSCVGVCWVSRSARMLPCMASHLPHLGNLPTGTGELLMVHPWSCVRSRMNAHYLFAANPWSVIKITTNPPTLRWHGAPAPIKGPLPRKLQSVCLPQMACLNQKITLIPKFTFFHCSLQQHIRHAVRTKDFLVLYKNLLQLWGITMAVRVASWLCNTNCQVSDRIAASQYQEEAPDERKGNTESLIQLRQVCCPCKMIFYYECRPMHNFRPFHSPREMPQRAKNFGILWRVCGM